MRHLLTFAGLFLWSALCAQQKQVVVANHPSRPAVQVKYYVPELYFDNGVNVYRRELPGGEWTRLNTTPVRKGTRPQPQELSRDKELAAYVNMLDSAKREQIQGLVLLTVLIKSFTSESLSRYLGILHEDASVQRGKQYEYRIARVQGNGDSPVGTSAPITAGNFVPIDPPAEVQIIEDKKEEYKAAFSWRPETDRYFGVNVYRSVQGGPEELITRSPVLISKVADESGSKGYSGKMFEDDSLQAGRTYTYRLAAVDFFGRESARTAPVRVEIKDTTFPPAPDRLTTETDHAKLRTIINWRGVSAADLAGYYIYRASRSDGPSQRVTPSVVPANRNTFTDQVPRAAGYYYHVASVDRAGNESPSGAIFVEVKDVIPPAAPGSVTIRSDTGKISVAWRKNSEPDLLGYLVYRTVDTNDKGRFILLNAAPISATQFVDNVPIEVKNKFVYRIVAVDSVRNKSEMSAPAATRLPDVTAPAAPFIKSVTLKENSNLIEWLPNADRDAKTITLWKTVGDQEVIVTTTNAKTVSFEDQVTASVPVREYYATVTDSSGNVSEKSNRYAIARKEVRTVGTIAVTATFDSTRHSVVLDWPASPAAKGFVVYRKENGGEFRPHTGMLPVAGFTDAQVKGGRSYSYRVREFDERGIKAESDAKTVDIKK